MSTPADPRREEALREYYQAQSAIETFDARSFQIKSWSITVAAAAAGAAYTQEAPGLFGLGILASVAFWVVDALWKSFQVIWGKRASELEAALNQNALQDYTGPRINATFRREFKVLWSWLRILRNMVRANVMLPHLPIALMFLYLHAVETSVFHDPCADPRLAASICAWLGVGG